MQILDEIFTFFGSKRALALKLECTPQAITGWERNGVPANAAIEIERMSEGRFKAVDIPLCPKKRNGVIKERKAA